MSDPRKTDPSRILSEVNDDLQYLEMDTTDQYIFLQNIIDGLKEIQKEIVEDIK